MKILVTDAQVRNAIAVIRSLGAQGHEIYTCDSDRIATGFYSKYVKKYFVHPNNMTDTENYIKSLNEFCAREKIAIILPVRDESVLIISQNRDLLDEKIKIPITDYEKIQLAADKGKTCKIARDIDVPVPVTYYPKKEKDLEQIEEFPVILKPIFGSGSRGLFICKDRETLKKQFIAKSKEYGSYIVQEYIPIADPQNSEFDWYGIYDWDSTLKGHGCFRRIRSYPLNSGPSTFKESVENPVINEYADKILSHIKWQSLVQLDFRVDARDNVPKLMEINPRLWASVQHTINIGLNIPQLWLDLALEKPLSKQPPIKVGHRSRWLLPGDILWFLKAPKNFENIKKFLNFKNSTFELIHKNDWKPIIGFFLASIDYLLHKNKRKMIIRKTI